CGSAFRRRRRRRFIRRSAWSCRLCCASNLMLWMKSTRPIVRAGIVYSLCGMISSYRLQDGASPKRRQRNMTETQLRMFRMRMPKLIKLSVAQREVLAWVVFSGGNYAKWPRRFQPGTLRSLIDLKLVSIIAYSPARYLITPLGRAVRARYKDAE